jgi:DNA-binding protein HU-beta
MNKSETITAVAEKAGTSTATAAAVLEAFFGTVAEVVGKGKEKMTIPGWISFEQTKRAARRARNLQTGAVIKVPATKAVRISAGSKLKAAAKNGGVTTTKAAAKAPAKKAAAKAPAKKAPAKKAPAKAPAKKAPAKAPAKKAPAKKAPAKAPAKKAPAKKAPAKKAPAKKAPAKKAPAKRA